jgi:hypothetical protein
MNKTNHKSKKVKSIRLTLLQASEEFGVTRETLRRAIKSTPDFQPKRDGKLSLREIHALLSGDVRIERARLTKARANREELRFKKEQGELVPRYFANREIGDFCRTVMDGVRYMPHNIARAANPENPSTAKAAFTQWLDEQLGKMRMAIAHGYPPNVCPWCGGKNPAEIAKQENPGEENSPTKESQNEKQNESNATKAV